MDYYLQRFLKAQDAPYSGYADALAEIRQGRKRSHWIWYVFPQMKGLGHSFNSGYYGISCRGEAEAYIGDAVLGARLREVAGALLAVEGRSAREILGGIDALKVMSSMTLFDAVAPGDVFAAVLDKYYGGRRDARTLSMLDAEG